MIWFLRVIFITIVTSMLWVTSTASMQESMFNIPPSVTGDPWFVATLYDAYFGFLTFYLWVAYKTPSLAGKIIWFVLIMCLGNIAMAAFMLLILFKLPTTASAADILLKKNSNHQVKA